MILKPLFESCFSFIFLALYYNYTELFIHGTNFDKTKLIFPNMFIIHIKKSFKIYNIIQTLQISSQGPILSMVGLYSKKCMLFSLLIYIRTIQVPPLFYDGYFENVKFLIALLCKKLRDCEQATISEIRIVICIPFSEYVEACFRSSVDTSLWPMPILNV